MAMIASASMLLWRHASRMSHQIRRTMTSFLCKCKHLFRTRSPACLSNIAVLTKALGEVGEGTTVAHPRRVRQSCSKEIGHVIACLLQCQRVYIDAAGSYCLIVLCSNVAYAFDTPGAPNEALSMKDFLDMVPCEVDFDRLALFPDFRARMRLVRVVPDVWHGKY